MNPFDEYERKLIKIAEQIVEISIQHKLSVSDFSRTLEYAKEIANKSEVTLASH
jgi:hypothetical protein